MVFKKMQTKSTEGAGWGDHAFNGSTGDTVSWAVRARPACFTQEDHVSNHTTHHTTGDYWFPPSGNGYYLKKTCQQRDEKLQAFYTICWYKMQLPLNTVHALTRSITRLLSLSLSAPPYGLGLACPSPISIIPAAGTLCCLQALHTEMEPSITLLHLTTKHIVQIPSIFTLELITLNY